MYRNDLNLDLIRKYNVQGPRYTSYPPASFFAELSDRTVIQQAILRSNRNLEALSLYVHLPFCESLCWFCGCTTVITTDQTKSSTYIRYLGQEIARVTQSLEEKRKIVQLHFGGGSPTFCSPDQLRRLGEIIHRHFDFAHDIEAGVEIDPRRLTRDHLVSLREMGFNRASIGVQDNNPEVQRAVHRIQPLEVTRQAVEWIRETGFASLNIDLIYGLPYQTLATFDRTLDEILELQPDRFAVFSYAHVPWMKPAQKIVAARILPTPEIKLQLLKLTVDKLCGAGYVYIGMDHFARPDDELAIAQKTGKLQRNFQGYSTRGGVDIFAFGMSSISQSREVYWQNYKNLTEYYKALDKGCLPVARGYCLTEDDQIRREVIMQIMCNMRLDFDALSKRFGIRFRDYFAQELDSLNDLEADGLIHRTESGFEVTDLGRLLVRVIAMRFDTYLQRTSGSRHAMTI